MKEMKIELHYQFLETKNLTTKHRQYFEFMPWDGCQMVDIKSLLYFLVKIWIKSYRETNTNKLCSIKSIHI
jgi:hypothetical protein